MELKLKKALATGAVLAVMLGSVAGPALAGSDANATVEEDGNATSYAEDNDTVNVTNNNDDGNLTNVDLGIGISGLNSQNDNDDNNTLTTDDSMGDGHSDNFLNSNVTMIGDDSDGSAHSNASVGEDGNATANAYDNDNVTVSNTNHADVFNLTLGLAVSGGNSQTGNDDGNELNTGASDADAEALNEVNSNWTTIGTGHSAHADASVGEDGEAVAYSDDGDRVRVGNHNTAYLENYTIAAAVSGFNTQSGNDDDNSMDTGDSNATANTNNFVNNNVTVVDGDDGAAAIADGSGGGSSSANASVGEDGNATANAYDNDNVTVNNTNDADVTNVSAGVAVSGGNDQSDNDDNNSMTTGKSSGSSCSTNTVNSNWTVVGGSLPEGGDTSCQ